MSDNVLHKSGPAAVEEWLWGEKGGDIVSVTCEGGVRSDDTCTFSSLVN